MDAAEALAQATRFEQQAAREPGAGSSSGLTSTLRPLPDAARRRPVSPLSDLDVVALRRALASSVKGEVRFDAGSRALYANDFSVYRHVPIGAGTGSARARLSRRGTGDQALPG